MDRILIFDFDSTFTNCEALDVLAEQLALQGRLSHDAVREIADITELGMAGKMGFGESLRRRMHALNFREYDLTALVHYLRGQVTASILRNRDWMQANAHRIWIVSNGFSEFIAPVVADFGIPEQQVVANRFLIAEDGWMKGVDPSIPLSGDNGKPAVVKEQHFKQPVWAIGDGFSDYTIRRDGAAEIFLAFTENVRRQNIVDVADYEARTLDDVIQLDQQ